MDSHYHRRMVIGNSYAGLCHRIPFLSTGSFSALAIRQTSSEVYDSAPGHMSSTTHRCDRACSQRPGRSWCLLHLFHYTKKERRLKVNPQPQIREAVHSVKTFSHGVVEINHRRSTDRRLHDLPGPDGGVSPCPHSATSPQVSAFLRRKDALAVQGSSLWSLVCPQGFHQTPGEPSRLSEMRDTPLPLLGRPTSPLKFLPASSPGHANGHGLSSAAWLPDQPREEQASSNAEDTASLDDPRLTENEGVPDAYSDNEDRRHGKVRSSTPNDQSHGSNSASRPYGGKYGGAAMGGLPLQRASVVPYTIPAADSSEGRPEAPHSELGKGWYSLMDNFVQSIQLQKSPRGGGGAYHDGR